MATHERNRLPGSPSKALITKVRRELRRFGVTPPKTHTYTPAAYLWYDTWRWAANLADRSIHFVGTRKRWPLANEIASQYVFLMLLQMRAQRVLRLPIDGLEHFPEGAVERLAEWGMTKIDFSFPAPNTRQARAIEDKRQTNDQPTLF